MTLRYRTFRWLFRVVAGLLPLLGDGAWQERAFAAPAGVAEAPEPKTSEELGETWVRIRNNQQGSPLALEVAIVRYIPAELAGRAAKNAESYVDLVGAIHVGDRGYYRRLNRRFRQYDALLYELVAPENTVVQRGQGAANTNPLGALQNGMKTMLELEHQLERIDYTQPNFVHADLSPDEFLESMRNRNEGFMQMYMRMMGQAIALQSQQASEGESVDMEIFTALLSKDRPRMLKIALAKQFQSMESLLVGLSGPDGSTLITERNKRALEVLRQEQKAGKRKLAIFYGAGHLSDMHTRLVEDFGLEPVEASWLEAWDLRAK